jgi:hypothetical protein
MGVMVTAPVMVMMAMRNVMVVAMPVFVNVLVARHSHVFYRSPVGANRPTEVFFPLRH